MEAFLYLVLVGIAVATPIRPTLHDPQKNDNAGVVHLGTIKHYPDSWPTICPEAASSLIWSTVMTIPMSPPSLATSSTVPDTSSSEATVPTSTTTAYIISTETRTNMTSIITSAVSSSPPASSCTATVSPPAPTQPGIVSGCSQWYIAQPGDFCYTIADNFTIDVDTFMAWNPAVLPPGCTQLLAGDAYCVQLCGSASITYPSTSLSPPPATTTSTPAPSLTQGPNDVYHAYCGDGSVVEGWPSIDEWLDFKYLFDQNLPDMKISCEQYGVSNDSDEEIQDMKDAIQQVSNVAEIDPRFILAIIMQESSGCVRVITTQYSHLNPGLMQSYAGTGTCNMNQAYLGITGTSESIITTPCPQSEIYQMILDGTNGTAAGDGLRQNFAQQGLMDAVGYYRTAKIYNGGISSFQENEDSLESGCCTRSYVSDVAHRLMGWVNAPREFTC